MTIAIVGTPALTNTGAVFATSVATAATSHTTGNALVVSVHCEDLSATIDSVTDTAGNVFVPLAPTRKNQSQLMFQRQFVCLRITGNASNVVTATFSGSVEFRSIEVIELSYTGRLELDALAFDDRTTGATSSTFSVSPTAAASGSSIVVAAGSSWFAVTQTNTVGGFTAQAKGDNTLQVFTKIGTGQVGFPATFTYTASETLFLALVLREIAAPIILVPPSTPPVQVGDSFRLGVLAAPASGSLTYQWQDNSGGPLANISGETNQYLDVSTVTIGFNTRQYRVIVTDGVGSTTSATFGLAVSDRADANYFLRDVPSDSDPDDVRLYDRPDVVSASGFNGTLAVTLDAVTAAATAQVLIKGTLAVTLDAVTAAATAQALVKGTLATTLGDTTVAATSQVLVKGNLSTTLDDVTLAATGTVGSTAINGTLAVTLDDMTAAATAQALIKGNLSTTLDAMTAAATAQTLVKGNLATTLNDMTVAATGQTRVKGSLAVTLGDTLVTATGSNVSDPGGGGGDDGHTRHKIAIVTFGRMISA